MQLVTNSWCNCKTITRICDLIFTFLRLRFFPLRFLFSFSVFSLCFLFIVFCVCKRREKCASRYSFFLSLSVSLPLSFSPFLPSPSFLSLFLSISLPLLPSFLPSFIPSFLSFPLSFYLSYFPSFLLLLSFLSFVFLHKRKEMICIVDRNPRKPACLYLFVL